ncbi:MAG: hypothetical protein GYA45_07090 [Pelolinea sp.]|jgi:hypothetical protein|nr:hypothetical protein [Pelolinea sp.]
MSLSEQIERIQELLEKGNFPNEASISQGIVLPILQEVGWNIYDPRFVIPEYSVSGRRVDFALLDRRERPVIFIEVKMLGNIEDAEEQLFSYAFHQGVPFLILTDGKEWNFFLPQEVGNYQDRKLYKLDFLERETDVIIDKLMRYLTYANVINGTCLDNAKDDYKRLAKSREAELTIPEAWNQLLQAQDEILIELLADKVEDICGFKPNKNDCIGFLESHYYQPTTQNVKEPQTKVFQKPIEKTKNSKTFVTINGNTTFYHSARGVMIAIITYLAQNDSTFLERFQEIAHGSERNFIARNKMDLYPKRPDLSARPELSKEFLPGWWIGLNYSKQSINKIIQLALKHSTPEFSSKIQYSLDCKHSDTSLT